jgi:hypothetical protein
VQAGEPRIGHRRIAHARAAPGRKLMTPGGRPAASISFIRYQLESTEVVAGFHTTVLPIRRRARQVPPIDVKLKGVIREHVAVERRCSRRFHAPARTRLLAVDASAKCALKRQKSIISQAASISAWCAVFDWPEHRRGVDAVAPRTGEQLGRAQEDRRALLPGERLPGRARGRRRVDRLRAPRSHPPCARCASTWRVSCGHHDVTRRTRAHLASTETSGISITSLAWRVELGLEASALGAAGRVAEHGSLRGGGVRKRPEVMECSWARWEARGRLPCGTDRPRKWATILSATSSRRRRRRPHSPGRSASGARLRAADRCATPPGNCTSDGSAWPRSSWYSSRGAL